MQAITIRQEIGADDKMRFYVMEGWPDEMRATPELLGEHRYQGVAHLTVNGKDFPITNGSVVLRKPLPADGPVRIEGNKVRFVVENGEAIYQRVGYDGPYIHLRKITSSLEPELR